MLVYRGWIVITSETTKIILNLWKDLWQGRSSYLNQRRAFLIGFKKTNKATSKLHLYTVRDLVTIHIKFEENFIVLVGTMHEDKLLKEGG